MKTESWLLEQLRTAHREVEQWPPEKRDAMRRQASAPPPERDALRCPLAGPDAAAGKTHAQG